jgi:hypothetical protein
MMASAFGSLMMASAFGSAETIEFLLNNEANIDERDSVSSNCEEC